jgi:hypothetical protein
MALVFQLIAGEDFYVNHNRVVVESVVSPVEFVLLRTRDGAKIPIREGRAVEIFKGVFVSAGARGQSDAARVAIEAPHSVLLLRGDNYRKSPPPQKGAPEGQ